MSYTINIAPSAHLATRATLAELAEVANRVGLYSGPWGEDCDEDNDGLTPTERREWFDLTGHELPGWDEDLEDDATPEGRR